MSARITVVGDILLDRDLIGTVERVCPDAPVPVLDVVEEVARPGGAGLAAALLSADGHDVTLVAAVCDDLAGHRLHALLSGLGIRLVGLASDGATREKVRLRTGEQSLLRLDSGRSRPPAGQLPTTAIRALAEADAVLVSDYAGGVTRHVGLRRQLSAAAARRPLVWDPHVRGEVPVEGVRLVTPNRAEATVLSGAAGPSGGAGLSGGEIAGWSVLAEAHRQADLLADTWQAQAVVVTLGDRGALLSYGSGPPLVVPALASVVGDTCGAGDRFAASVTAQLAVDEVVSDAVRTAVRDASEFVAAGGATAFAQRGRDNRTDGRADDPADDSVPAAQASTGWQRVEQVRERGGTVVATGGCFDLLHAGHITLLRAARGLGDCLVVCLNSDSSVRRLKGVERPLVPEVDRARVLEALECVDAVLIFAEDTPAQALRQLRPHIWAKGGDYALADLPEAGVLAEWEGQAVVLPYLDGRSTTRLIGAARALVP